MDAVVPLQASYPLHGQRRSRVHAGSGASQKLHHPAGVRRMSAMDVVDNTSQLSAVRALADTLAQQSAPRYP
jgi:hypothetical protein